MATNISGVNPALLVWARERAGLSLDEVGKALGKTPEVVREWEAGESVPTYVQLEKLAYSVYRRPLAIFFFPEPPSEPDPGQSFRTLPEFEIDDLSADSRYRIRQARAMQIAIEELTEGKNPADRFILDDLSSIHSIDVQRATQATREYLGISFADQRSWKSQQAALTAWRDAVERVGVFVFKDTFKQREVSGFSLYHARFPVIYLNNSTAKSRQSFTLFHELAHLLVHTSGITKRNDSYIRELTGTDRDIEIFCNQFAANILVPESMLQEENTSADDRNVARLARVFRVSREVIFRRMLDLGWVSRELYEIKAAEWSSDYFSSKPKQSGGNYYATLASYLSDSYARLAFQQYYRGALRIEELAQHLNVKIKNVPNVEQAMIQKAG